MKTISKYNKNIVIFIPIVIIATSLFILGALSKSTKAVKATDFNAGRIIDDEIFYNKNTMSVSQIQNFLDNQIGHCDVWGTQPAKDWGRPDISRAQFAKQTWGINPPFVCLNKYHENPTTKETSFEKGGGSFQSGISAAQIIYDASQKYSINPQVLLTLLKKESSGPLTNDKWPLKKQYQYAMGYACPDSGPGYSASCSNSKAGFYHQITLAAWQLDYYRKNANSYSYKIGWNNIQYSPNPSCGTKRVNIENIATLSLYIYTPYTPNDSSLSNYPGTSHCGSYGNRNFFMFFNELFGSTYNQKAISSHPNILSVYKEKNLLDILGASTSEHSCSNKGCKQNFEKGSIYHSSYGTWENFGRIKIRYDELGAENSVLGWPYSGENKTQNKSGSSGVYQRFQNGYIIGQTSTGYWENYGDIRQYYNKLGLEHGDLGFPTGPIANSGNNGKYQRFENGYIIGQTSTGYWESRGSIRKRYQKDNFEHGKFGLPIGPETPLDKGGWIQKYQNGLIAGRWDTGYWEIWGSIGAKYLESGGPNESSLGHPTSDEQKNADNTIIQYFENGYISGKDGNYTITLNKKRSRKY